MAGLVVGVAARNEEGTIYPCLEHIFKALKHVTVPAEVIVCVNKCTDRTEEEIYRFMSDTNHTIRLLYSGGNLIDAQRKICYQANQKTCVFIDADSLVDEPAIKELLKALKGKVKLAYGSSILYSDGSKGKLAERVYRLYNSQVLLTKRKYFHGRIFATNSWYFPTKEEVSLKAQAAPYLLRYGGGLVADDVFLSAYIIDVHGEGAIQEVKAAKVLSASIQSWRDWWFIYRRAFIEVRKIRDWFPELSIMPSLRRYTNWSEFCKSSTRDKYLWVVYLFMKSTFTVAVKLELQLAKRFAINPNPQWQEVNSTKSFGLQRKLIVFDIDGTLIAKNKHFYLDLKLKKQARRIMKEGDAIGLATHRSLRGSIKIYNHLGLNGPLVAEGGARLFLPDHGRLKEVELDRKSHKVSEILNQSIINYLYAKGIRGVIHKSIKERSKEHKQNVLNVYLSNDRIQSSSLYVFEGNKPSSYQARKIQKYLRSTLYRYGLECEIRKDLIHKLHVYYEGVSKISTLYEVQRLYFPGYKTILIGDDEATRRIPGLHLIAVKESTPAYRKICDYVAAKSGGNGLVEIISHVGS